MAEHRLKIKIGQHEFEAEGPVDIVQAQFAAFSELVSKVPTSSPAPPAPTEPTPNPNAELQNGGTPAAAADNSQLSLDKIMRVEGRYVSLTVSTNDIFDATLLILLGQRHYRSNDSVTGAEVLDGLRESGTNIPRIDYQMQRLAQDGFVITVGSGRGRRYRLNNRGVQRAQEIARELVANVP